MIAYPKLAWILTSPSQSRKSFYDFNTKYSKFISLLIYNSQLSQTNLIISLYYLHKYHTNRVLQFTEQEDDNICIYTIITSLVLSNKSFDDQSYTLKTWLNIINNSIQQSEASISLDLKLLNSLESYFLSSLNYKLSFGGIYECTKFWNTFEQNQIFRLPTTLLKNYKMLCCPDTIQVVETIPTTPIVYAESCLNSPVSYPLTPVTPYDDGKRRKLFSNVLTKSYINYPQNTSTGQYNTPQYTSNYNGTQYGTPQYTSNYNGTQYSTPQYTSNYNGTQYSTPQYSSKPFIHNPVQNSMQELTFWI